MKNSPISKTRIAKTTKTRTTKANKPVVKAAPRKQTKSKLYSGLDRVVGTWDLRVASSTKIGVKVSSRGTKKGTLVQMILPSTTPEGLPCTVRVNLSGRQARAVFETLGKHQNKS